MAKVYRVFVEKKKGNDIESDFRGLARQCRLNGA